MKLTVRMSDIALSEPAVLLNGDDCLELGVSHMDRIRVMAADSVVTSLSISDKEVPKGVIGMPRKVMERCGAVDGGMVEVSYAPMPESARSIRKKINGGELSKEEIDSIINDINKGDLSQREILAFVSSFNINNSNLTEVAYLTRSMAATGKILDIGPKPVLDFHSLGGVPGNKITPIVVSIVASEGLLIPKMSSRAISSACGTSDYVDTFCDVELDTDSLISAMKETNGVFACGNENYAPVGSKIIAAERPMGIDPWPVMMASIMSKKVSIGISNLLVDIPMGSGSKIHDIETARRFAKGMIDLGTILGIHVECAVSRADQPIGKSIGPILEARECIRVLENKECDPDVIEKACGMAGILLEMAGEKDGRGRAYEILKSGQAHKKFKEIVKVQNGNPDIKSEDLVPGGCVKDVHAKRDGIIQYIDNAGMVAIAKGAGAPEDVGAGIELLHKRGDRVKEGDVLFKIYAENQGKLNRAIESARSRRPMEVQEIPIEPSTEMMIEQIPSKEMLDLIRFTKKS